MKKLFKQKQTIIPQHQFSLSVVLTQLAYSWAIRFQPPLQLDGNM